MLQPADILLTRGRGWLARAIRFFTRSFGEARTKVSHVAVVVEAGPPEEAVIVEALSRVKRHPLWARYGPPADVEVAVFRPLGIDGAQARAVVEAAEGYVGRPYGYLKIAAHLADWALLGVYAFRRLARMDDYPICSWLVAHAFKRAGIEFGTAPGAASPDDIHDWIETHPDRFREILPLGRLGANGGS